MHRYLKGIARYRWGERQALFRDRRAADVAAQPFELRALVRARRHPGMQRETGHITHPVVDRFIARRQRLQREHLAALLRPDCNAACDRRIAELSHRLGLEAISGQAYLERQAEQNPAAFMALLGKVLPLQLHGPAADGGHRVAFVIEGVPPPVRPSG